MPHHTYLIIGGGMTAAAAIEGIRHADPRRTIGLIGAEPHPPYDRPPLSKGLWKGKPFESIWRQIEGQGVTLHLGRTVRALDPQRKQVTDDQGTVYSADKLLLATGGTPRRLPFGGDRIIYFRTLDDYQQLRALTEQGQRFAVIGGGFIGSEIAAALTMNGKKVVMVFPDEGICGHMFPADLAGFLNDFYRQKGVEVLAGQRATGLEARGHRLVLTIRSAQTADERVLEADGIVAGIGIEPNVELARAAGLKVENGIVVDASLRTSHPDIFAAGDVASFANPALGMRLRVEHEDNANTMGRLAGQAMAGQPVSYDHLPFFYSDLFELGYEAVGEVDSRLEVVADWKEPNREGVVYYLRDGRVRGVLLWNVWEQVDAARRLIAEPGPFRPADLKGRLPARDARGNGGFSPGTKP
jgi:NADPH-dependent 2,4-dienoyl-CoA reductase/sulfur reductase-like enzyme